MRKRFLASVATLAAGAGLWAQSPQQFMAPPMNSMDYVIPANHQQAQVIPPQMAGMSPSEAGLMGGDPTWPPPGNYADMFNGGKGVPATGSGLYGWPVCWVNFEYLLWQPKSLSINYPLATTGASNTRGVLGAAATGVLNNGDMNYGMDSGFRVTAGFFTGDDRRTGWEGSAFMLGQQGNDYSFRSDTTGFPLIARPFVNSVNGAQSSLLISGPNLNSGSLDIQNYTRSFGAEINYLVNFYRTCPADQCTLGVNVNGLVGGRYMEVEEGLDIRSASTTLQVPGAQPTFFLGTATTGLASVFVNDSFSTYNQFYGGQFGLQAEVKRRKTFLSFSGKLGLGAMHQTVDVFGSSMIQRGSGPASTFSNAVGGLFANTNTIGRYRNDEFAVLPEFNLTVGWQPFKCVKLSVGYNYLYLNNVARPTDVIVPAVNPAVIPTSPLFGTAQPFVPVGQLVKQSDYSLQGLNFSVMFQY